MEVILNKQQVKVCLYTKFISRFKLFRFKLEEIKEGICLPHKRRGNTYLFCQMVDVFLTDDEFRIIKIIKNLRSEKFIFGKKCVYYMFMLPQGKFNNALVGDVFKIKFEDQEKENLDIYNKKYIQKYLLRKNKTINKKKKVSNKVEC